MKIILVNKTNKIFKKTGKRNRNENINTSNSKKKVFYREKMANLISE